MPRPISGTVVGARGGGCRAGPPSLGIFPTRSRRRNSLISKRCRARRLCNRIKVKQPRDKRSRCFSTAGKRNICNFPVCWPGCKARARLHADVCAWHDSQVMRPLLLMRTRLQQFSRKCCSQKKLVGSR